MEFFCLSDSSKRKTADLLVIPLIKDGKKIRWPDYLKEYSGSLAHPISAGDFQAKEGEVLFLYPEKGVEKRVALLGLGDAEKITVERLRRSFSNLVKASLKLKLDSLNVMCPSIPQIGGDSLFQGIAEGLLLANYQFDKLKTGTSKEEKKTLIKKVTPLTPSKMALSICKKAHAICEAVYLARDLVNDNADTITPQYLGQLALQLAKKYPAIKTTVHDKKWLEKEKMGLLLAVNRGSSKEPVFIVSQYKGNPKSSDHTILVGKGVTYDTGGLNLKPVVSMSTMKCDMGGAAAVLATLKAAAELKLKVNITAVIPSTENSIGSNSYKPGDVYSGYLGKTVEIMDTDAEGRLILADALAYAVKHLKPTRIIDLATLTGAIEIALGNETTGLFSNNDVLADSLIRSGSHTYERVWRMPLFEEYKEQLRSEIADIKNTGGRPGGAITAALFLQEFVGDTPWCHLDIAGTAHIGETRRYHPKFGTGIGVRLLVDFLEHLK